MEQDKVAKEELLEKAKTPAQDSLKMHAFFRDKIEVIPKCVIRNINDFAILEQLRAEMTIPVRHDDQQGTATVTVAGLMNALKLVGKKMKDIGITIIGIGAANVCIVRMLIKAGAQVVVTGRSGFPNQVNNSVGFFAIFRGALAVRATTITDEMCVAAAKELAKCAEEKGLHKDYLLPTMDEWEIFPREAVAVAKKAMEQGVARLTFSEKDLFQMAETGIRKARDQVGFLMEEGIIEPYKE